MALGFASIALCADPYMCFVVQGVLLVASGIGSVEVGVIGVLVVGEATTLLVASIPLVLTP